MNESSLPQVVRAGGMPAGTPELAVVIVGAGACGLTTGIALRRAGVDCVILERDARATGSTALSSGFIPAAETALQKSLGIEDTHEMLVEDIVNKAHGQAPRPLVQAYVEAVTEALDVLQAYGLPFEIVDGFLYPGHRVRRMHSMPEKTGETFITRLEQLAVAQGVDILLEALVRELWVDADQRVLGVGYQRPDGQMEYLACRQLMLACNGFGGNPTLVRELLPEMAQATFAGHQGNDGTAIGWARQLGLRMADLDAYQGHGSWVTPQGALMTWAFIMEGGFKSMRRVVGLTTKPGAIRRRRCMCWRSPAVWPGMCSTGRCWSSCEAFPIFVMPKRRAPCAWRPMRRPWPR